MVRLYATGFSEQKQAEEQTRSVDTATQQIQGHGHCSRQAFDPAVHSHVVRPLDAEIDLRRALEREELTILYQPIFSLETVRLVGFDALLHWRHPQRELFRPGQLIAVAETSPEFLPIGWWMLREVCHQLRGWQHGDLGFPKMWIGVNIFAVQLAQETLVEGIDRILRESGLDGSLLTPEITERAMITLAHALGMDVVADGVETKEQVARLRSLDCEFGQGEVFSPPLDAQGAGQLLVRGGKGEVQAS